MRLTIALAFSAVLASVLLTGCAISTPAAPSSTSGLSLQGVAQGGQQPIGGARVYLLAANTTANANYAATNPSVSLLTSATGSTADSIGYYVTTGSAGQFSITGDYSCTAGQQVYLLVLGGNPGLAGANNANIGLMSVLGNCPSSAPSAFLATIPFIYVNEVSTIAAAYSMSGYATDATHVFTSGSALASTGMANAFANFANLANVGTGVANTVAPSNPNSTAPQATINTLADILASCVNSRGITGPNSAAQNCATLFANATADGTPTGAQPTETATAAINIAHHPWANVAALYGLQAGVASPFPGLSSQPNDLTVGLTFTGNGLNNTRVITIDASGNAWVVDYGGSQISKFTPAGAVASGSPFSGNSLSNPFDLSIDTFGNVWVPDYGSSKISIFTPAGGVSTSPASPLSGNGLASPSALAFDPRGNAWVTDFQTGLSIFTAGGAPSTSPASPIAVSGSLYFDNLALDLAGNAWVTSSFYNSLYVFTSTGALTGGSPVTGNNLDFPFGVAIDASGNAWVVNAFNNSLDRFTLTGSALSSANFTGGGLNNPNRIAIDGTGKLWVENSGNASVSEFSSAGAPLSGATGLGSAYFGTNGYSNAIAVDGSGNVWTADGYHNILIELVGAASPVVTPKAANLVSPYGSHAVQQP